MHSSIQFYFLYTLIILISRCRIKIKTWIKTRNYSKMTSYKRMFTIKNPHGPGGVFFAWQRTSGGFLATTGYDQVIHIYNRHADLVEQLRLPGMCSCFGWDKDGDLLAVITDKSANLLIWDANSSRSNWLDTCCIKSQKILQRGSLS